MNKIVRFAAVGIAAVAIYATEPPRALASPVSAIDTLKQFNVVVFGDLNTNSDVEGRTLVLGNVMGGSGTFFTRSNLVAPSDYGALVVAGSVSGGWKNVNGNGNASIAGDAQNMNMNGGTAYVGGTAKNVNGKKVTGAKVDVPDVETGLKDFSTQLTTLKPTSAVSVTKNKADFVVTPDAAGQAIFEILDGGSFFKSINEITFTMNGADSVVINVGGTDLDISENFLGGIGSKIASSLIWNFYEASKVTFGSEFFGTVLAPYASIHNGNAINGSVVADNFTLRGAARQFSFTGDVAFPVSVIALPVEADVPEPAALALLLGGIAAAFVLRRRMTAASSLGQAA